MTKRNPIAILSEIVDECTGFRRTDALSHIPASLLQDAKDSIEQETPEHKVKLLTEAHDMVGRTVEHVFDSGLKRGSLCITFTDGAFAVLRSDEGDEYIDLISTSYGHTLEDYVEARDLIQAKLITKERADEIKRAEQAKMVKDAEIRLSIIEREAESQRKTLEKLKAQFAPPKPAQA